MSIGPPRKIERPDFFLAKIAHLIISISPQLRTTYSEIKKIKIVYPRLALMYLCPQKGKSPSPAFTLNIR